MSNQVSNDKAATLAASALCQLSEALAQGDSDALKRYLAFCGQFHRYSFRNQLLIAFQRPEATFVAGFKKWCEMGRWVKKGAKGIAILVPVTYKKRREDKEEIDAKSKPNNDDEAVVVGFTTGYVFDIAQTDGEPVPEFRQPSGHPVHHLERLIQFTHSKGIKLAYSQTLGGARGVSKGGEVVLLDGMLPAEEFLVLAHEVSHELMHRGERRIETTRQIRELEAESVAYAVTTAIGIECSCSFDYIRLYNGDEKLLAQSLTYIQQLATEILDHLI